MTQEDVYKAAKAVLLSSDGKPTAQYQAYMKYEEEWKKKVNAFNTAYAKASTNPVKFQDWPIEGKIYHYEVDEAWNEWLALGFKNEIEKAIGNLTDSKDPVVSAIVSKIKQTQR